jgi:Bacterial SH3 domain
MKRTAVFRYCIFLSLLTAAVFGLAEDGVVKHRATLRHDPSSKHKPIVSLEVGEDVELITSTQTNGYYHVRTLDGDEGWVYARNLDLVTAPAPSSGTTTPSTTPAATNTGVSSSFSQDWDKPTPTPNTFQGPDGECGPSGDGGDSFTNLRKNRVDAPASYHEVTWKALQSLPYPNAARSLAQWTDSQIGQIRPYEGVPVSVVGYLVKIKVEDRGTGESTNCHFTNPEEVDWHMPLAEHSGDAERTAIVVETTPRIRKSHPKWTTATLAPWVNSESPVRISGWTLLDPEHRAQLGQYRSTLWEVHPITKIEVFSGGQWVDLDVLP